jgi:2-aminobenzoate-CoA ligase
MHFHRDLLIIADSYAKEVLEVTPDDVFVGSPPATSISSPAATT